ncbi:MAG: AIR synthase related protein [Promethearchaeota archaeon]|jgi:selenophosphate synthetase-related protein
MTLQKIADSIRTNQNIIEKKEINPIIQYIDKNSFKSKRIFTDIGEDAATIKNDNKFTLVTTDRIKTVYIENFAYGAGYSSILVSVDDIYACGGTPLAASIIISVKDPESCEEILKGICAGSNKFKVPIIRGHTNVHGKSYELSSTMIGEINKEDYISAGNAQIGDNVILAVDTDGKIGKASKFYYDTTTFKSSEEVLYKRKSMNEVAKKHLANASKDVSNGGIFGTVLQLIKYSKVGADININKINIPLNLLNEGYDLETYLKMYLTTSFVLTAPNSNCREIIDIFHKFEMSAEVIGKIINDQNLLRINNGTESIDVIRF